MLWLLQLLLELCKGSSFYQNDKVRLFVKIPNFIVTVAFLGILIFSLKSSRFVGIANSDVSDY